MPSYVKKEKARPRIRQESKQECRREIPGQTTQYKGVGSPRILFSPSSFLVECDSAFDIEAAGATTCLSSPHGFAATASGTFINVATALGDGSADDAFNVMLSVLALAGASNGSGWR